MDTPFNEGVDILIDAIASSFFSRSGCVLFLIRTGA